MPYIKQENRLNLDESIDALLNRLFNVKNDVPLVDPGELNYVFSKMVWRIFENNEKYSTGNMLVGVLECVKQEFYRKLLSKYEDLKELENGSL